MVYHFPPIIIEQDFVSAVPYVTKKIEEHNFSIVSNIPVSAKVKAKLGQEIAGYHIIGFCQAKIAAALISKDPRIGVMLPCNAVVRALDDSRVEVVIVDLAESLSVADTDLSEPLEMANGMLSELHRGLSSIGSD
ncbi:hypothetical protein P9112_009658 [Eukaryota sp. TZLM1-RC]